MNVAERKYRFSEIMSAVSMLPTVDMDSNDEADVENAGDWVLPNLTKGLSDTKLVNAILCQAHREDSEFKFKLLALLTNSAIKSINARMESDSEPNPDDVYALAISANILWGDGQAKALYGLLGMLGSYTASNDIKLPDLATAFLRPNSGIEKFGKLDPFALLEGEVSQDDVQGVMSQDDGE